MTERERERERESVWERECGRVCERENERMIELWAPPTQNCPNRACVCDRKRERDSV